MRDSTQGLSCNCYTMLPVSHPARAWHELHVSARTLMMGEGGGPRGTGRWWGAVPVASAFPGILAIPRPTLTFGRLQTHHSEPELSKGRSPHPLKHQWAGEGAPAAPQALPCARAGSLHPGPRLCSAEWGDNYCHLREVQACTVHLSPERLLSWAQPSRPGGRDRSKALVQAAPPRATGQLSSQAGPGRAEVLGVAAAVV